MPCHPSLRFRVLPSAVFFLLPTHVPSKAGLRTKPSGPPCHRPPPPRRGGRSGAKRFRGRGDRSDTVLRAPTPVHISTIGPASAESPLTTVFGREVSVCMYDVRSYVCMTYMHTCRGQVRYHGLHQVTHVLASSLRFTTLLTEGWSKAGAVTALEITTPFLGNVCACALEPLQRVGFGCQLWLSVTSVGGFGKVWAGSTVRQTPEATSPVYIATCYSIAPRASRVRYYITSCLR